MVVTSLRYFVMGCKVLENSFKNIIVQNFRSFQKIFESSQSFSSNIFFIN